MPRLPDLDPATLSAEQNPCTTTWPHNIPGTYVARGRCEYGISETAIEAIKTRRVPHFDRDDEQIVYDVVTELSESKALSRETYAFEVPIPASAPRLN